MAILYYDEKKLFQLNTENTTYVIGLSPEGYVGHVYYGPLLHGEPDLYPPEQSFKRSIWREWQKKTGTHLAPVIKRNGGTGKENRKSGISGKYFKRAFREACRM